MTNPRAIARIREHLSKHAVGPAASAAPHDAHAHAEAAAVIHHLKTLDKQIADVLDAEGLLFDGAAVKGRDILARLSAE